MSAGQPATIEMQADGSHRRWQERGAKTLAELFAEVCERFRGRTAVTLGDQSVTYGELDAISGRVAAGLRGRGVRPGARVAICLERSIGMIAAMLGVVKAGGAYVPIDPGYPAARIAETLADASPALVIGASGVAVEELMAGEAAGAVGMSDAGAAYVIYTSGSTGRPKGVQVSHRNAVRLLAETEQRFHFTEEDVWTMFHSFAFDFSVWEIWGCLLHGGRLVIVPFAVSRTPEEFYALLVRERVTVLNQTPTAFAMLDRVDAVRGSQLALRLLIFGGEALALGSLRGWFARHGDSLPEMVNMYGITETTVHVTHRRVLQQDAETERESLIGEPIGDLRIYLLDENLLPVADGAEGEICVGGGGVAMGYLKRPELTAERFVADPFGEEGARMYRSGDRARRRADGELVYLGRRDGQVKVNGFRVEAGEVEAALAMHPEVTQACVVAGTTEGVGTRLTAYFVARTELKAGEVSEFLTKRLPAHMLPAFYRQVAAMPLTVNGKVDRAALGQMAGRPTQGGEAAVDGVRMSSGSMEERVAAVWRDVLAVNAVGVEENFFDVGGTSLLLTAVRARLKADLGREIPVVWMFECATVRALAKRLAEPAGEPASKRASAVEENALRQRQAFARARAGRGVGR